MINLEQAAECFVARFCDAGNFVESYSEITTIPDKAKFFHRLLGTSLLYTLASKLNMPELQILGETSWDLLQPFLFKNQDSCCFLYENMSSNEWNAMGCIIAKKSGRKEVAEQFGRCLLRSWKDNSFDASFAPATLRNVDNQTISNGLIVLALQHLGWAKPEQITGYPFPSFSPYSAWSCTIGSLQTGTQLEVDKSYVETMKMVDHVPKIAMDSATSLMVAISSQIYSAGQARLTARDWINRRNSVVLNRLHRLQVTDERLMGWNSQFVGGFVRSEWNKEIRIDSLIQGIFAALQYQAVEQEATTEELLQVVA